VKLTIDRDELLNQLSHVHGVVKKYKTACITENVLISAHDGIISMTTTDTDIEIMEDAVADVRTPGKTTVPASTLYDIVCKMLAGAKIEMENSPDGSQLTVKCGRSIFKLGCLPVDDFPQLTGGNIKRRFELAASDLRSLIDHTSYAVSTDETRYYLNGIYIHVARNLDDLPVLRAVATDGNRLARADVPLPAGALDILGVIIPNKTVNEIRKLINNISSTIEIALSATSIQFDFDSITLTSKLIDGTFPDYNRVIPTKNDKVVHVKTKDFLQAVDRVSAIFINKKGAVKLTVTNTELKIHSADNQSGSAYEEIDVEYEGQPIDICFNSRFLMDAAKQISGENIKIAMSNGFSPIIILDKDDDDTLYVIMPLRG